MTSNFCRALTATVFSFVLAGCSQGIGKEPAEAGAVVARFREDARSGNHRKIYRSSSESFRSAISEDHWLKLSKQVELQLGKFRSGDPNGARFAWKRTGPEWLLGFNSEYELGPAREHFLMRHEDGNWKLAGYHIGSDQLSEPEPGK
jgi:hypothetical protein